jgi:hypothetical protein
MNLAERPSPELQWMVRGHNCYQMCGRTALPLPAGAYTVQRDCYGNMNYFVQALHSDDYIDFPDSLPSRVLQEITHFWTLGERFHHYGFLHRRGYLFYGKQGGGKSSLINQVVSRIVAGGHVAFYCDTHPSIFSDAVREFRVVEPTRPLVCVFEDIDALIKEHGDSSLLQCLDGNQQVDTVVNLASTNYPERLDRRIIARPRRFDRIYRIDAPDARFRAAYFARKMPEQSEEERHHWVRLSEGLPFAALAELVISVQCLGNDLEEMVGLLRRLDGHQPSSSEFQNNGHTEDIFASAGASE